MVRVLPLLLALTLFAQEKPRKLGLENAISRHLSEEDLTRRDVLDIIRHGKLLFNATWTEQDGAGRPLMKGTSRGMFS